jgi:hypothetical protein
MRTKTLVPLDTVLAAAVTAAIEAAKAEIDFDSLSPAQQAKFETRIMNRLVRGVRTHVRLWTNLN